MHRWVPVSQMDTMKAKILNEDIAKEMLMWIWTHEMVPHGKFDDRCYVSKWKMHYGYHGNIATAEVAMTCGTS